MTEGDFKHIQEKNRLLKPYQIKDLAVFIFYFFLAFPKVFGRVFEHKKTPSRSWEHPKKL